MLHELHHGGVVRCFAERPRNLAAWDAVARVREAEAEAVVDDGQRLRCCAALLPRNAPDKLLKRTLRDRLTIPDLTS